MGDWVDSVGMVLVRHVEGEGAPYDCWEVASEYRRNPGAGTYVIRSRKGTPVAEPIHEDPPKWSEAFDREVKEYVEERIISPMAQYVFGQRTIGIDLAMPGSEETVVRVADPAAQDIPGVVVVTEEYKQGADRKVWCRRLVAGRSGPWELTALTQLPWVEVKL